jgi:hypothetical protein
VSFCEILTGAAVGLVPALLGEGDGALVGVLVADGEGLGVLTATGEGVGVLVADGEGLGVLTATGEGVGVLVATGLVALLVLMQAGATSSLQVQCAAVVSMYAATRARATPSDAGSSRGGVAPAGAPADGGLLLRA